MALTRKQRHFAYVTMLEAIQHSQSFIKTQTYSYGFCQLYRRRFPRARKSLMESDLIELKRYCPKNMNIKPTGFWFFRDKEGTATRIGILIICIDLTRS